MSITTLLLILLVVILIAGIPTWPHSRGYGWGPSGIIGVMLIVLLVMVIAGYV